MRLLPLSRVTPIFAVSAIVLIFALAACGSDDDDADSAGAVTPVPTLVTISTPEPAAPADDGTGGGSAVNGEALFAANACTACHSTGSNPIIGPGLEGVGETAATRVSGKSADDYLSEAIRDPGAFLVEGFTDLMPANFGDLPEGDIDDLIAYLKSL